LDHSLATPSRHGGALAATAASREGGSHRGYPI